MGSLCSKSGTHTSEDVVVHPGQNTAAGRTIRTSTGQSRSARPAASQRPARKPAQAHTLGGPSNEPPPDPRAAAALAAEQRLKEAKQRGVVASNPKRGQLAAQLEANKAAPRLPEPREEQRLVWD